MNISKIAMAVVIALLLVITYLLLPSDQLDLGSVGVTDEYNATTTAASTVLGSTITGQRVIKEGKGTLGSVVITGANTGIVNIYDATTSVASQRAKASSTIHIASIPASTAAGTYTFDVVFNDGLLITLLGGNMPTTTVTFR